MIGFEPTMAERVRYIGHGFSAFKIPDTDDPAVPSPTEVTVPVGLVTAFDIDCQNVADALDDWSVNLHDRFRELSMAFIEVASWLDYDVSIKKKAER